MENRRRFERLNIPGGAGVYATDLDGGNLGKVAVLGRGGCLIESGCDFAKGQISSFIIVDDSEKIRCPVRATVRDVAPGGRIGFEFVELDPDSAVEIGVMIGKYYSAANS